jgi:phage tail-like protein
MPTQQDPATSVFFRLTIDGDDLGTFNTCSGLSCEVVVEQREEGGSNGYVWQLPTRVRFSNVTLTRPLTPDTAKVAEWFASIPQGVDHKSGEIAALTPDGSVLVRWGLLDVVPVRWQGPTFDPSSPQVATESVEIAHHGFVD